MDPVNRTSHAFITPAVVAVALGLILRFVFLVLTPIGSDSTPDRLSSYNDEVAHVTYALHVLKTGMLPSQIEAIDSAGALQRGYYENYQPPLYYVILAGTGKLLKLNDRQQITLLGRFLGILLFGGMVWVWLKTCLILPAYKAVSTSGIVFLSLSGVMVRFTSTATNDPLFWICAGGLIWICLLMWHQGLRRKWLTLSVLFAVIGLYSKLTMLLLLPLPLLLAVRYRSIAQFTSLFVCLITTLLLSVPLWLRNVNQFGSLIPIEAGFGSPVWRIPDLGFITYAFRSALFPWSEFWQGYVGLLVMAVPAVYIACRAIRHRTWKTALSNPVSIAAIFITASSFIWLNLRYDQAEARYLLASWPIWCLLLPASSSKSADWMLLFVLLFPYLLMATSRLGV
jgi:hypothetical protein